MGLHPRLTEAQRAAAIDEWAERNAKRTELLKAIAANKAEWREIRLRGQRLRAELKLVPSNAELGRKHAISAGRLTTMHAHHYKSKHPADRDQASS